MSVSISRGLVPRSELTSDLPRADELSDYKVCSPGDIVLNRMRAFQGALGLSEHLGMVSPDYAVLRPTDRVDARYLTYVMRSDVFVGQMISLLRGIGGTDSGMVRTPRVNLADLNKIAISVPTLQEQRRIADFLDDRVGRIDWSIAARREQLVAVKAFGGGQQIEAVFRASDQLVAISTIADVRLGRQRSPAHESGEHMTRYLRSANVGDGQLRLDDVLVMNFEPAEQAVFGLRPADVLVTEGSASADAVGAAAAWHADLPGTVCFQNTLLRLRATSLCDPRFLEIWARASHASGAARTWASGASILHLGAEGMARMLVPRIDVVEQRVRASEAQGLRSSVDAAIAVLHRSIDLLTEYKSSLITAAVRGEFDVSASGSRISA